ncbi:MAG: hypothetical protein ACIARQ_09125 [Phycisphaerales bacterium JB061]
MSSATMHAPGTKIRCTISKVPMAAAKVDTIERMMRQDPANAKALKKSQKSREEKNNFYIRGNRIWGARAKCSKITRCTEGNTWEMTFTPQIGPDLASVSDFLKIEKI